MKILVLGGTRFIGRHIVEGLLEAGHQVSVFTRGQSPDALPPGVERIRGDRNNGAAGLDLLVGHTWDACVDVCGYTPRQVRPSAELLWGKVDRYVFVSTVSVYHEPQGGPILESHALLAEAAEDVTEVTGETYGPLKVTCERIVGNLYGDRCTILRPQIVAGPWDPTGRHTYWVQRAAQEGEMLAPGDGTDAVQVVDARDIARFTHQVIARSVGGVFNMAGPRLTWSAFLTALGARDVAWVPAAVLAEAEVPFTELPLFIPNDSPHSGVMHVGCEAALAAGFTLTEPARTIADTRAWLRTNPCRSALSPERERELIARARGAHA